MHNLFPPPFPTTNTLPIGPSFPHPCSLYSSAFSALHTHTHTHAHGDTQSQQSVVSGFNHLSIFKQKLTVNAAALPRPEELLCLHGMEHQKKHRHTEKQQQKTETENRNSSRTLPLEHTHTLGNMHVSKTGNAAEKIVQEARPGKKKKNKIIHAHSSEKLFEVHARPPVLPFPFVGTV